MLNLSKGFIIQTVILSVWIMSWHPVNANAIDYSIYNDIYSSYDIPDNEQQYDEQNYNYQYDYEYTMASDSSQYLQRVRLNRKLVLQCQMNISSGDDVSISPITRKINVSFILQNSKPLKVSFYFLQPVLLFNFKEVLFNQSLLELRTTILPQFTINDDYVIYENHKTWLKNPKVFERIQASLDGRKKSSYNPIYEVDTSKYSDSGHYYCVYSNNAREILIKSYRYQVYDG